MTILADTNRDGRVDVNGASDMVGKEEWTNDRGALFLANIGDTNGRCALLITEDTLDEEIDLCNDASDDILRNADYLAPLFTLPIDGDDLSTIAQGSVAVVEKAAVDLVRIFSPQQGAGTDEWVFVNANHTFTADELTSGLTLGIDARDVRRPDDETGPGWDGRVTIKFTVTDGDEEVVAEDTVALRVAPVLTHHHAQPAERVFVTGADEYSIDGPQGQFVKDLQQNTLDAGIEAPVYVFESWGDTWTQDFFEAGYTSIPGPDGPIVLRVLIRSAQQYRSAGRELFTHLRDGSIGAIQLLKDGDSIDSTGNLEAIPPYTHNGKSYPAGRIVMGSAGGILPEIFPFLQAQETQDPLELDTGWLSVGHVDEFLQFLPAAHMPRGWVLMLDDPRLGVSLLEDAVMHGHADTKAISRPRMPYDWPESSVPGYTVSEVLALPDFVERNELAAVNIDKNLEILKRETGITDEEIFRLPALFYGSELDTPSPPNSTESAKTSKVARTSDSHGHPNPPPNIISIATPPSSSSSSSLKRRQDNDQMDPLWAFYPGIVNGAVLSDAIVLAPNPWGPVIDGRDILAAGAEAAYAQAGYNITWQDDWFSHHVGQGEIHCGSNTWRSADVAWWKESDSC